MLVARNAFAAPQPASRSSASPGVLRARSQARIAARLASAIAKNARTKCQRWRRRDTE